MQQASFHRLTTRLLFGNFLSRDIASDSDKPHQLTIRIPQRNFAGQHPQRMPFGIDVGFLPIDKGNARVHDLTIILREVIGD